MIIEPNFPYTWTWRVWRFAWLGTRRSPYRAFHHINLIGEYHLPSSEDGGGCWVRIFLDLYWRYQS